MENKYTVDLAVNSVKITSANSIIDVNWEESSESGGINYLVITLTDGSKHRFPVHNGKEGTTDYNKLINTPTKLSDFLNDLEFSTDKIFSGENFVKVNDICTTINNDVIITDDKSLTVKDLYVTDFHIVHSEEINTENDYVILRVGATSGLTGYAGFEIKNYDGKHDGRLVVDSSGTARVGDKGDEQPLSTRAEEEELTNDNLLKWDATDVKIVDAGVKVDELIKSSIIDNIVTITEIEYKSITPDSKTLYLITEEV